MKKSFKLITFLLAVLLIAGSLCSCEWLDEKKANQGVYSDDRSEIVFQDNTYRLVNTGKYEFIFDTNQGWGSQCVTAKEVPVLLAESFGDWMYVLHNNTVLCVNTLPSALSEADGYKAAVDEAENTYKNFYYVRSDKYDDVKKTVENAKLNHYYFEYWGDRAVYKDNPSDMLNESYPVDGYNYFQIKLDDDLTDAVNKALKASTNEKVSYKELSTGEYDIKELYLYPCDEDMLLTQTTGQCYLIEDHDKYYLWDGNYYEEYSLVAFDESESESVKELFEKYPDAVQYSSFTWQFEDLNNTDEPDHPVDNLMY